jgi:hypothetical protein
MVHGLPAFFMAALWLGPLSRACLPFDKKCLSLFQIIGSSSFLNSNQDTM